mmetsp:Transcript_4386/g.11317  ORF Transcript_4386/g.11317 Transcript_4386/m.11317 type:complete len:216 (-) Transcript_4386:199-846(-)
MQVLAVVKELLDLAHGLARARPQHLPQLVDDVAHAPCVGDPLDQTAALGKDDHIEGLHLQVAAARVRVAPQELVHHDTELHHARVLTQVAASLGLAEEGVLPPVVAHEGELLRPLLGTEDVDMLLAPLRADELREGADHGLRLTLRAHQRDRRRHLVLQRHDDLPLIGSPHRAAQQLREARPQAHRGLIVRRAERCQFIELRGQLEVHDHELVHL